MKKVIKILMNRDGYDEDDARSLVEDTITVVREMIGEGDFQGAEDYWMDELGLEPDYLLNILI